jgi:hypothetical protein
MTGNQPYERVKEEDGPKQVDDGDPHRVEAGDVGDLVGDDRLDLMIVPPGHNCRKMDQRTADASRAWHRQLARDDHANRPPNPESVPPMIDESDEPGVGWDVGGAHPAAISRGPTEPQPHQDRHTQEPHRTQDDWPPCHGSRVNRHLATHDRARHSQPRTTRRELGGLAEDPVSDGSEGGR